MLRLRPFRPEDEQQARAVHRAFHGERGMPFLLDWEDASGWQEWLDRHDELRRGLKAIPDRVPATFLGAFDESVLVGRVSVRHELNRWLAAHGGHIGYAVAPDQRRRGYGRTILEQGLILARSVGVDDVLIMCDDDNVASATIIESCGGALEAIVPGEHGGVAQRRYWIR